MHISQIILIFVQKYISMRDVTRHILLGFLSFFIVACHSPSQYKDKLSEIELYIENNPKLAIKELNKINLHIKEAPKEEQIKYALLKIRTEDKLFIPQKSDSTMLNVVEYYETHGTHEELLIAYYLLSAAYRDMNDSPRAIEHYTKTTEFGEQFPELKHHPILARSYSELANLLVLQLNHAEALNVTKKQYLHSSPDDHDAAHELGERYFTMGKEDSATIYLDIARQNCINNEKDTFWIIELIGSQLGIFTYMNDQARIDECLQVLNQYPDSIFPFVALSGMATYYSHRENNDSTCYYWEKAKNCNLSNFQLQSVENKLMRCYLKKGMTDEAIQCASKVAELTDSIYNDVALQQSSNAYNQYIYSRNEQQRILEQQRIWQYAFIGYFTLSLIAIVSLYVYYRNKSKLKKTIEIKDGLQRKNVELSEAYTSLETRLQENIELHEKIDGRALAQVLHSLANENNNPTPLTKEQTKMVYHAVELNYPETVERINSTLPGISPFDRSLLYILKLGLNQSEAARLLDRKRSTISHRLAVIEKSYNIPPKSILDIDMDFARSLHDGFL